MFGGRFGGGPPTATQHEIGTPNGALPQSPSGPGFNAGGQGGDQIGPGLNAGGQQQQQQPGPGPNAGGQRMNPVDAYTRLANSITQTSDAVAALANALQGANLNNSNSDQGYRHLKPKKDLQKVTGSACGVYGAARELWWVAGF